MKILKQMIYAALFIPLLFCGKIDAQIIETDSSETEEAEIILTVEEPPQFPGGESARMEFLRDNIKYPQTARESGIQGTVYVSFIVERNGSLTNIKILRSIGGGCDELVIRIVKCMPKWKPGKQDGKTVRVQFTMPVKFTLNDGEKKSKKERKKEKKEKKKATKKDKNNLLF